MPARSDRGVGIKYGPDVTTKFCSQNRLRWNLPARRFDSSSVKLGNSVPTKTARFLVRSHQVPEDGPNWQVWKDGFPADLTEEICFARRGFQKQHNDRCVTVFSASNYCGDGGSEYPVQ